MTPTVPYGCSTFCCTDLPLRKTLEQIRAQTRRIEILSEGLHDLLTYSDVCTGIAADFSVHAPCSEINLAGLNVRMRNAGLQVIDDLCVICDAIRATTLVVHPGYSAWNSCKWRSFVALFRSLDALAAIQQEHDVRIGIGNMGAWDCCHFKRPDLVQELQQRDLLECIPRNAPCIIEVRTIGDFEQSIAYLEGLPECGHTEVLNKACGRPRPWQ
jgi:sugar phosphate isomerase/epimerase